MNIFSARVWMIIGSISAAIWFASVGLSQLAHADAAEQSLEVYIDGVLSGWSAGDEGGNTYIPLDRIDDLGGKVTETDGGKTYLIAFAEGKELRFTAGENLIYVDGVPERPELATAEIGGEIHIPVQWVSDLLGIKSIYDPITGSLMLFNKLAGAKEIARPQPSQPAEQQVTVSTAPSALSGIELTEDLVRISTTGPVSSPQAFKLKNPDRIVIDLPDAMVERAGDGSAGGSVEVDADHPYISGIRYSYFNMEPATVRVVIDLKHSKHFVLHKMPEGMGITVRFSEVEPVTVMIDAGHGGSDPGAISRTGKFEKDLTLPIANKAAKLLQQETLIVPVMLRSDDSYISPADRAAIANQTSEADLFVSIHANTAESSAIKGSETYYWRDDSYEFAQVVHRHVVSAFGSEDRKVKRERFVVVRETTMPAVLLELGFLTNPDDEAKLYNGAMQDDIAEAIVQAIKEYYSIP